MATIRATCPDCGDIELTVADVGVRVCIDDHHGSYTFRCPECRLATAKPASPRIVDLLVSAGVRRTDWRLPAELTERRSGPTIDHDDLLDFHVLLSQPGWLERFAEAARP